MKTTILHSLLALFAVMFVIFSIVIGTLMGANVYKMHQHHAHYLDAGDGQYFVMDCYNHDCEMDHVIGLY